jgi:hypothetical protein
MFYWVRTLPGSNGLHRVHLCGNGRRNNAGQDPLNDTQGNGKKDIPPGKEDIEFQQI